MKLPVLISMSALSMILAGCATIDRANKASVNAAAPVNAAASQLKAFPEAEAGYQRFVLYLPKLEDESLYQVSLSLGKRVKTDSVNRHFMLGAVEAVDVAGWGYTYYKLESKGQIAGTLMAVPPSAPKVERFVEVNHQLGLLRYNSRLPIVVIVPEGFEVKYRVWSAGALQDAPQG